MKLSHQFRDLSIEKEIHPDSPLGFFISNKNGGMLYFDAAKDQAQYFAQVGGRLVKVFHDIHLDGEVVSVGNKFHSLDVSKKESNHTLFVPYYMNGLLMTLDRQNPVELVVEHAEADASRGNDHSVYEADGRVLIKSTTPDGRSVFTAIQGDRLTYDHNLKPGKERFSVHVLSQMIAVATSETEQEALNQVNYLFTNHKALAKIQEQYMAPANQFKDPEAAMAYVCVMNGTDHMFVTEQDDQKVHPAPHFSDVAPAHATIASNAFLSEGEFKTVKKTLIDEVDRQTEFMQSGAPAFKDAAWPVLLFGRLMNRLCAGRKLYRYFTREELADSAARLLRLIHHIKENFIKDGELIVPSAESIESHAMLVSILDLEYALSKDERVLETESILKKRTKTLLEQKLSEINENGILTKPGLASILLTAYVYPLLMEADEWKAWFDKLLELAHHNLKTLRSKTNDNADGIPLELELFGITNLAAIVLNRIDAEHYEKTVNEILRQSVNEVLYKGLIGRPTSAYEQSIPPEKKGIFQNHHFLNNAFFLEMLRECA